MRVRLQEAYIQNNPYTDNHNRKTMSSSVEFRTVFVNPEQIVSVRENPEYSRMFEGRNFSTIITTSGIINVLGSPEQVEEALITGKQLLNG